MSSRGGASSSSDVVKETVGSGIAEGVGSDCEGRQIELLEVYQHLKASSTPAKFLQDENSSKVIPSFSTVVLNRKNFGADGPDEKKKCNTRRREHKFFIQLDFDFSRPVAVRNF